MSYTFGGPPRRCYQKRGLAMLVANKGVGALLFDPGMGKTATAIDYAGMLAVKSGGEVRVLVACPLAAVDTWVTETGKWLSPQVAYWAEALGGTLLERAEALADRGGNPFRVSKSRRTARVPRNRRQAAPGALNADKAVCLVTESAGSPRTAYSAADGPRALDAAGGPRLVLCVVNLDAFASTREVGSRHVGDVMLDGIERYDPHLVIVDEMHKIKSPSGSTSRLFRRIGRKVPRRIGLTGTFMPHSPLDVWGQWQYLSPYTFMHTSSKGGRKPMPFGRFKERYATFGGYYGRQVTGFQNIDELQDLIAPQVAVAKKDVELDLPPTTDVVIPVNLAPAEAAAYASMKAQLATLLATGQLVTAPNRLAQMMRLRQITAGHLPDDSGTVHVIGNSKAATIRSIVHDMLAGEKRIVVFAVFRAELDQLEQALTEPLTHVFRIDGDTPPETRVQYRKRFGMSPDENPKRYVLLAQVRTMSLAVNELVSASHCVFASLPQTRDDLVQARDRLNRIGQTRPVTYWYAQAPGTVDDVILKAHQERTDLEAAMLRHIQGRTA